MPKRAVQEKAAVHAILDEVSMVHGGYRAPSALIRHTPINMHSAKYL